MAMTADTRQKVEAMIEGLIALLDASDGDCDLEDTGDDEPWINSTPVRCQYDLELETSDDEFSGDENEPVLGWNNPHWPIHETPALTLEEKAA